MGNDEKDTGKTLSVTVEGKEYSLDPQDFTLGQAELLSTEYGIDTMGEMNFMEFPKAIAIVTVALTKDHDLAKAKELAGKITYKEILASVEDDDTTADAGTDSEGKANPTATADAGGSKPSRSKVGSPAKPRRSGGRRK